MQLHMHHKLVIVGVLSLFTILLGLFALNLVYYDAVIAQALEKRPLELGLAAIHLERVANQNFLLKAEDQSYPVSETVLRSWFEPYVRWYTGKQNIRVKEDLVSDFLRPLAIELQKQPTNAQIIFKDGRVQVGIPEENGQQLDIDKTISSIIAAMHHDSLSANIVFTTIQPPINTDIISQLDLKDLLGHGESNFSGSPNARRHNIGIGANIFNGMIIYPNQEFSFNTNLGTVDETTGYLPELVIRNKHLIPEYGGGLCQVSTTLFRAAMTAGLPIIERAPHSFPVKYYNPQGYDAAIYPGVIDLKFVNDTGKPIILQSQVQGNKLIFDMFGTSDKRQVTINEPRTYHADESGALKTVMSRAITYANGEKTHQDFYSNYKSPALFTKVVANALE